MPPPTPPRRAKLHQLLALFQRFLHKKLGLHTLHAPPHPPPVGQSYINSLRCSSGFCIKNWVCTRSMPPPPPPVGQSYINSLRCSSGFCIKNWVCTRSIPPPHTPPRAKLHQLLALFQRFLHKKLGLHTLHAPPTPPLGQSYINSLRCSSGFCIKNWVCTRSMPPPHTPP